MYVVLIADALRPGLQGFATFPGSNELAVESRQYDNGYPALSYSPMMLYNSRCFAFVSSDGA